MRPSELEAWRQFYMRHPFDDYHRFARPAALVAHLASASDPFRGAAPPEMRELLEWLAPDRSANELTEADARTIRAMGFTRKGG